LGRQLSGSVENYNRAVGSLEKSVLPGARKFVELGIRPKKAIEPLASLEALPRELQEIADENEVDSTKQSPDNGTKTLQ